MSARSRAAISPRFKFDWFAAFGRLLTVLRSALHEIFEESAYARFLQRNRLHSSRQAYADFLRESEAARGRRTRCC
jgi:hypothetical protein